MLILAWAEVRTLGYIVKFLYLTISKPPSHVFWHQVTDLRLSVFAWYSVKYIEMGEKETVIINTTVAVKYFSLLIFNRKTRKVFVSARIVVRRSCSLRPHTAPGWDRLAHWDWPLLALIDDLILHMDALGASRVYHYLGHCTFLSAIYGGWWSGSISCLCGGSQ